jgi:hypothetical protein
MLIFELVNIIYTDAINWIFIMYYTTMIHKLFFYSPHISVLRSLWHSKYHTILLPKKSSQAE